MTHGQDFNTIDVLRLEVETDPEGLVNLVQNPSGELGGWGWVTPVPGSKLSGVPGPRLRYDVAGNVPNYFYTEALPIAAGQYASASWIVPSTGGHYRARLEWLDSAQAVISQAAQTGDLQQSSTRQNYAPVQAPPNTAYVRLRFDRYSGTTGTGNPGGGANPTELNEVTVSKAATFAELGSMRTYARNLITNPSVETNLTGWTGASVSRTSGDAFVGTHKIQLVKPPEPYGVAATSPAFGVVGGRTYTGSAYMRMASSTLGGFVGINWYDSTGAWITSSTGQTSTISTTYVRKTVTATAPANAATASLFANIGGGPGLTGTGYIDAAMVTQGTTLHDYFDGDTADTGSVTYSWTGTAHASASTAATAELVYAEPVQFLNILGESHEIRISREELNVGTLTATVLSSTLDPSQSGDIRPGRRCRLITSDGDPIFTGKLTQAAVSYELLHPQEEKRARIVLTAVDSISTLAQHKRPDGVATIDALPFVLEGAGVPWNVNGSGNQVPSATVVSVNENATALDQVAVTRDSKLGYAWVDRFGVLQAWDAANLSSTPTLTLDESVYNTDISIDYDTDRCINTVTVKFLRHVDGQTTEVPYGPYVDAASVEEWGPRAAEFTIHAADEDAAAIQTFAQSILSANGTPSVRVTSVTVPIAAESDLPKALTDLYALASITNTRATIANELDRVSGIEHTITPDKWLMRLSFAREGGVAQPQLIPPVQSGEPYGGPVRIGDIVMSGRTDESFGFVKANGQLLPTADYPALFAVYGYTHGGSGAQFAVPNMTDVFPIGAGTKALGTAGGSPTLTLPGHQHGVGTLDTSTVTHTGTQNTTTGGTGTRVNTIGGTNDGTHKHTVTGSTGSGGGGTHDIMNPWRALNFFVKARA